MGHCCSSEEAVEIKIQGQAVPQFEIVYLDCSARCTQLRMIANYCDTPHTNVRLGYISFLAKRSMGKIKFGVVPNVRFKNG